MLHLRLFGAGLLLVLLLVVWAAPTAPLPYHAETVNPAASSSMAGWVPASASTTYRARRAAADDSKCVYVASLKASMSSGNLGLKGSVVAINESGDTVSTFTSMPLAVAVDPTSSTLFVSTPVSIQQYNIGANLASGDQSCPCSFSTLSVGDGVIQTMTVDLVNERLFFARDSTICYRLVNGSEITCRNYNTSSTFNQVYIPPGSSRMYVTTNSGADVYVVSVANDDYFLDLLAVWSPLNGTSDYAFTGITAGPNSGSLYLTVPFSFSQPCAVVEMSQANGSMLSCFNPPADRKLYFTDNYGLLYNNRTQLFYTCISSSNSNATHDPNTTTTGYYDLQMFDLVPSGTAGQLANTQIEYLAEGLSTPADLTLGPCPHPTSPTPTPSHGGGADVSTVAVVVPVVLGSVLLLLICGLAAGAAWWLTAKKRRKYFDAGDEGLNDPEAGTEMTDTKFTFREIDGKDLRLGKLLGEGAFGKVYKGEYRGAVVAVKMFEALKLDQADDKVLNELRTEAQMMERLSNHPNIVKFVGAITKGDEGANFALVTEFCPRGSLYDLLVKNKRKLPLITLVRMARDAASGILHLHKEHIVHRDIAARNILVGQNYEVYVSDFGLARVQEAEGQAATTKQNFGPIAWMAPEALKSREYSEATDAFSFGVLLWEMMARKRPWGGAEAVQIITAVTTNTRLKIPKDCDPIFAHLMKLCWRQNPSQRPTFEKVADTLSSYYKKLHKLHDVNADAFEISDQEEESEDEMALEEEGMSYEEWQLKRIKDEVKSFMKQLITERNDDFELVAKANTVAFTELKEAFKGAQHSDDDDDDEDDDDDDDHGDDDDEGARKQKIYLENEVLFAESGESGGSDVPASSANVRMPTITYAELGRRDTTPSSSSVGATPAEAARASTPAPIPASQYAIVGVGSSSGRRGGGARTGEADGDADATPASHYFEVVRRNSQTPSEPGQGKEGEKKEKTTKTKTKTKSGDQVPLPASQYAVLERRSPVQQQQRHQEEEVSRDEAPAKGAVSSAYQEVVVPQEQPTFDGAYFTLGKTEDRKGQTGYEEITVAPSGHPQDTGYYGL